MTDDLTRLRLHRKPTAAQPLLGQTILAVEDSRFASEALRLLCMRSGARLRRADCLASARRHLSVYRPNVVLVDLGLPDGCGTELIAEIATDPVVRPVVLGLSGDPGREGEARAAGADGFMEKPVSGLVLFQQAILAHLPEEMRPKGPRPVAATHAGDDVRPDSFALQDDLAHAAEVLTTAGAGSLGYAAQFVGSVARAAQDEGLAAAAQDLAEAHAGGGRADRAFGHLQREVQARLAERRAI
jgi:CheY-like chemotaxis protein